MVGRGGTGRGSMSMSTRGAGTIQEGMIRVCIYSYGMWFLPWQWGSLLWLAWLVWRLSQGESRLMAHRTLAQAGAIVDSRGSVTVDEVGTRGVSQNRRPDGRGMEAVPFLQLGGVCHWCEIVPSPYVHMCTEDKRWDEMRWEGNSVEDIVVFCLPTNFHGKWFWEQVIVNMRYTF